MMKNRMQPLILVLTLLGLAALACQRGTESGVQDGTEVNGDSWHEDGFKDGLNYLGRDRDQRYGAGFRFPIADLSPGEPIAYARLRFPSGGSHITSNLRLVLGAVAEYRSGAFKSSALPSHRTPRTNTRVEWNIEKNWESGSQDIPLFYDSPDISSLIEEVLTRSGDSGEGSCLVITAMDDTPQEGVNYVTFFDSSRGEEGMRSSVKLEIFKTVYDTFLGKEFLSRVGSCSATISLFSLINTDTYVEYGTVSGSYTHKIAVQGNVPAGKPVRLVLTDLAPNQRYFYRLVYRRAASGDYERGKERTFHTQRAPGTAFRFAIQSDEHINTDFRLPRNEENLALYGITVNNIAMGKPDFFISMGDFVNTEFYMGRDVAHLEEARERYLRQRGYLDRIAHSIPFFLTIGNHEGENGWYEESGDPHFSRLPRISAEARMDLIPNPIPDGFFQGNSNSLDKLGPRANYYAWEWGDALLVVLDPFANTRCCPHEATGGVTPYPTSFNGWDWTLGKEQYDWLQKTLHETTARWKLVFIHHLTSTTTPKSDTLFPFYGRGGIEIVKHKVAGNASFEWGGENAKGQKLFSVMRPGWTHGPIHDLLVKEKVGIVFHGHDHFYAYQKLDGVVYQECPQPVNAKGYGYRPWCVYEKGVLLPNSGHLEVSVAAEALNVEYVRSFLPGEGENRKIAHTYSLE